MFDQMEIDECVSEGIVKTSYENPTREYVNHAGHSRSNRG